MFTVNNNTNAYNCASCVIPAGSYTIIARGGGGAGGQTASGPRGGAGGRGSKGLIKTKTITLSENRKYYLHVGDGGYLAPDGGNGGAAGTTISDGIGVEPIAYGGGAGGGGGTPSFIRPQGAISETLYVLAEGGGGGGGGGAGGQSGEQRTNGVSYGGGGGAGGGYYNCNIYSLIPLNVNNEITVFLAGLNGYPGRDAGNAGEGGNGKEGYASTPDGFAGDSSRSDTTAANAGGTKGGASGGNGPNGSGLYSHVLWGMSGAGGGGAGGGKTGWQGEGGKGGVGPYSELAGNGSTPSGFSTETTAENAAYGVTGNYGEGGQSDTRGVAGFILIKKL